jgi:hypothetical protein
MEHVVLARRDDGQVILLDHGDGPIFPHRDAAIDWLESRTVEYEAQHHLVAYQMVELDEL